MYQVVTGPKLNSLLIPSNLSTSVLKSIHLNDTKASLNLLLFSIATLSLSALILFSKYLNYFYSMTSDSDTFDIRKLLEGSDSFINSATATSTMAAVSFNYILMEEGSLQNKYSRTFRKN